MNRVGALSVLILLSPLVGPAQNTATKPGDAVAGAQKVSAVSVAWPVVSGLNCPVGLRAQRQGTPNMVIVDGTRRYDAASQRIRLFFKNWQVNSIVGVSVTVHGFDTKPRYSPVGQASIGSAELKKTVDLNVAVAGGKDGSADLTLRSFGSVSRVDLESVEYADGTRWEASPQNMCQITPDLFMLVSR